MASENFPRNPSFGKRWPNSRSACCNIDFARISSPTRLSTLSIFSASTRSRLSGPLGTPGRRRRFRSGGNVVSVVSVVYWATRSVAGSGRGGRRQRGLARAFSSAAFGSGGGSLRKRRQRRWDAQGLDLCIQRNGGDVALGPYLLHRFFRHQRRFDLFYGIVTVFRRIEGQHLAQFRQGQLDHLASGDGHGTLRVDLHYHVMNALAHRHRAGHRQLFVFRPAAGLSRRLSFSSAGLCPPRPAPGVPDAQCPPAKTGCSEAWSPSGTLPARPQTRRPRATRSREPKPPPPCSPASARPRTHGTVR